MAEKASDPGPLKGPNRRSEMEGTELKQRARKTWSAGVYDEVATRIWSVGGKLVERVAVAGGERVLDVACGSGNAAIPAAAAGARVSGLDITPELFEAGRRRAAEAGVEVEWVEGDAEELPFEDASFDVVLSTFGCMFAPRHGLAAAEIARVLRPGGRLGIASWRPAGTIGEFLRTIGAHAPPPPEGFQPPTLWGAPEHVEGLFDGQGVELRFEPAAVGFRFESIDEAVEEYGSKFGPIVVLRAALEPEGRWPALRDDLAALFERANRVEGGLEFDGEYLIALGDKRDG